MPHIVGPPRRSEDFVRKTGANMGRKHFRRRSERRIRDPRRPDSGLRRPAMLLLLLILISQWTGCRGAGGAGRTGRAGLRSPAERPGFGATIVRDLISEHGGRSIGPTGLGVDLVEFQSESEGRAPRTLDRP